MVALEKKKKESALGYDKIMMMELMKKENVDFELRELLCPSTT